MSTNPTARLCNLPASPGPGPHRHYPHFANLSRDHPYQRSHGHEDARPSSTEHNVTTLVSVLNNLLAQLPGDSGARLCVAPPSPPNSEVWPTVPPFQDDRFAFMLMVPPPPHLQQEFQFRIPPLDLALSPELDEQFERGPLFNYQFAMNAPPSSPPLVRPVRSAGVHNLPPPCSHAGHSHRTHRATTSSPIPLSSGSSTPPPEYTERQNIEGDIRKVLRTMPIVDEDLYDGLHIMWSKVEERYPTATGNIYIKCRDLNMARTSSRVSVMIDLKARRCYNVGMFNEILVECHERGEMVDPEENDRVLGHLDENDDNYSYIDIGGSSQEALDGDEDERRAELEEQEEIGEETLEGETEFEYDDRNDHAEEQGEYEEQLAVRRAAARSGSEEMQWREAVIIDDSSDEHPLEGQGGGNSANISRNRVPMESEDEIDITPSVRRGIRTARAMGTVVI
ncbi:hypothetical protein BDZ91DRAFT_778225 [Kalaharituber pfeilii]|nr:hypothetical protein BDZ91DRAFT_778225 [Kalaharituber pfeilii]